MFKVNNKEIFFTSCSSVSIVNFEQVDAGWGSRFYSHFHSLFKVERVICKHADHTTS